MNHFARLAALLREAADVCDDIASESPKKQRAQRKSQDAASVEALRKVQDGLRRNGFKNGNPS